MSCEEIREQLVETARARELSSDLRKIVFDHATECAACDRHLDNEQRLTHALSELAISVEGAPVRMEQAILRQMKVVPMRRAVSSRWIWSGVAAAAAATVLMVSTHLPAPNTNTANAPKVASSGLVSEDSSGFTQLPYAPELGPEEQAEMVRVQMPREALTSMGIPMDGQNSDEQIQADVLVGMDGTARAIRVAN
jgi:hypothetical protein